MAERDWVRLEDLPPGALFETRDGRLWACEIPGSRGRERLALSLADGMSHWLTADAETRELLPDEAPAAHLRRLLEEVRGRALRPPPTGGTTWGGANLVQVAADEMPQGNVEAAMLEALQSLQNGGVTVAPHSATYTPAPDTALDRLLTRLLAWCGLCDQERALLRRLAQEPADRLTGLALADWWEEAGRLAEADALRDASGRWTETPRAAELSRLRAENDRFRAALTQLAAYEERPEVTPSFDSPWAARLARQALEGK